jgi:hypothetical protein
VAESRAVELSMVELEPGPSRGTGRRLADTLHHAVKAEYARAHSAATITVASPEAILLADEAASAAVVAERMAAAVTVVAGVVDVRSPFDSFRVYGTKSKNCKI